MPVLDTSFVIDFLEGDDGARRTMDLLRRGAQPLGVTPHVVYELYQGVGRSRRPEAEQRKVDEFLAVMVSFGFSDEAGKAAGLLDARLASDGVRIGPLDLLIGVTALVHGETLVTRDRRGFGRIPGLEVLGY